MSAQVHSISEVGNSGTVIDIECHISNGLPNIVIVGFANRAVDEAKERLRSAFTNSNLELPKKRITLNLAPADIPKDDTSFDLAMSAAILMASDQHKVTPPAKHALIGELSLDGTVRPVRGIVGKVLAGREQGLTHFFIPAQNLGQASLVPKVTLIPVPTLKDLYRHLCGLAELQMIDTQNGMFERPKGKAPKHMDFSEVVGQARAKRALEIAAAGAHNVLLNGPPGTGKSMLARALPSILPELTHEEILQVTHLHSLASKQYDVIVSQRPFRSPHHTASDTSIIGGGQNPKPGEISLSHSGVLFFDEFPEFHRSTIEALRQPLEDRVITVARAKDTVTYPANFILIATSNPCPCGYYGSAKACQCMPYQVIKYQRKLSGPIIDRIDICVDVEEIEHSKLLGSTEHQEKSERIVQRVSKARAMQYERFGRTHVNADMSNADIKRLARLSEPARDLLNQAAERLGISARAYMRTVKVARTIADLSQSPDILPEHIGEALQYRRKTDSL